MSSTSFDNSLPSYLRPNSNIFDLFELFDRFVRPRRPRDMSDPPNFPIPPINSPYGDAWLPERPPLPPGWHPLFTDGRNPTDLTNPTPFDPPSGHSRSHASAPNDSSPGRNIASTGQPGHVEPQHGDRIASQDVTNSQTEGQWSASIPNTSSEQLNPNPQALSARIPFVDRDASYPRLPPISTFSDWVGVLPAPLTLTGAGIQTGERSYGQGPTTAFDTFARPTLPALASLSLDRILAPPMSIRAAPPTATSTYSSSISAAPGLTQTVNSTTSNDSMPTPSASASAQAVPWQPQPVRIASGSVGSTHQVTSTSAEDSHKRSSATTILNPSYYAPGAHAQSTRVNQSPLHSPTHNLAFHPRAATPPLPLAARRPSWHVFTPASMAAAGSVASAPVTGTERTHAQASHGGASEPGRLANAPDPGAEPGSRAKELPPEPLTGTTKLARARPGGLPHIHPDQLSAFFRAIVLSGVSKHYRLFEYCIIERYIYAANAPDSRFNDAIAPQSSGSLRPVFTRLSVGEFEGARNAEWLHKHFKVMNSIYRNIYIFFRFYLNDFPDLGSDDLLVELLGRHIEFLQWLGVKIDLHPWHLLVFVRESWYFRMNARLENHPNVATFTQYYSGMVDPPAPAARRSTRILPPRIDPRPSDLASSAPVPSVSTFFSSPPHPTAPHTVSAPALSTMPSSSHATPPSTTQTSLSGPESSHAPAQPPTPRMIEQPQGTLSQGQDPGSSTRPESLYNTHPVYSRSPLALPSFFPPGRQLPHSGPPSVASAPRNPSVSSLRAPRESSSGRQARNATSATGSASGVRRTGPHSRAGTSASASTPRYTPTEASITTRITSPQKDAVPYSSGMELLRSQRKHEEERLAVQWWQAQRDVEHDSDRVDLLRQAVNVQERAVNIQERESEHRMGIARANAIGDTMSRQYAMFAHSWTTQHDASLNTINTVGAQHPLYSAANRQLEQLTLHPVTQLDIPQLEIYASARVDQSLAGVPTLPPNAGLIPPAPRTTSTNTLADRADRLALPPSFPSLGPEHRAFTPATLTEAGPSNYPGQLRDVYPTSNLRELTSFDEDLAARADSGRALRAETTATNAMQGVESAANADFVDDDDGSLYDDA
ncbi:hypothetical protein FRC12_020891 [Ceratobasidium sp. 428]|nr:hypothetical protein FRC12_020891 [Ceratobasidium sp. 428]